MGRLHIVRHLLPTWTLVLGIGVFATQTARAKPQAHTISIRAHDADIRDVLRLFAKVGDVNIVVAPEVSAKVSLSLKNAPWDAALSTLLRTHHLGMQREDNIIFVDHLKSFTKRAHDELALRRARIQSAPMRTVIIPLNYARAEQMKPLVKQLLSKQGSVSVDRRTNSLVVTDRSSRTKTIQSTLSERETTNAKNRPTKGRRSGRPPPKTHR